MKIGKQARRDAKQLFRGCQVNGLLDESRARQTVRLLVEKKPRGYVDILMHFQRLVQLDVTKHTAAIESAAPLADALKQDLQRNLNRLYGEGLQISFKENPRLIGGLRIRVGSDVYDGSVLGRLGSLRESFQ